MSLRLVPAVVLICFGCSAQDPATTFTHVTTEILEVRTLSFPAHWLVTQVGGDLVSAQCILPVGEDAADWQPDTVLIASLPDADLIVANGAGFESWVDRATLPEDKLVNTSKGLDLLHEEVVTHSHGADGGHSHGGVDPHTWSSPSLYAKQARNVQAALSDALPDQEEAFQANTDTLVERLAELSGAYADVVAHAADRHVAANHPAYDYLARELRLDIHSFGFDPVAVPDEAQLAAFSAWSGDTPAAILLWETEPSGEAVAAFPEGVRHVVLDPLEQPGEDGTYDYLGQAKANVKALEALFSPPAAGPASPQPDGRQQHAPRKDGPGASVPGPQKPGGKGKKH